MPSICGRCFDHQGKAASAIHRSILQDLREKDGPSIRFDRTTTFSPTKYMGRMMKINGQHPNLSLKLAGNIVSAYVSNNAVPASELPNLIGKIHLALSKILNGPAADTSITIDRKATPAQIHESIRSDALISFIDGKAYRMLKRHLASHGLDPKSYRERYGLPADYPMIATGYAAQRSQIAKAIGLGQARAHADQRKTGPHRRR
jgi:predicted transcriptional regulator